MVEVIDFNDLQAKMTDERGPVTKVLSDEEIKEEKKGLKKSLGVTAVGLLALVGLYFFITYGGSASEEGIASYRANVDTLFSSIRQDFPNLKDITCTEADPSRKDCVVYTFTFYPNMDTNAVGTQMDTVGKANGVTQADMAHLKEYMKNILQIKQKYMRARRAPLTITISSTNVSRQEGESSAKVTCTEDHGNMECMGDN